MRRRNGSNLRQWVPDSHIAGYELVNVLEGAEVIGYELGGTFNQIQIRLTDGDVVLMSGFFANDPNYRYA